MSILHDIRACLQFYSRLPAPAASDVHAAPDFARVGWATPIAGAIIGAVGAAVVLLARLLHLPPLVAAVCAVAALALATGALHEDGLGDVADGFGGGVTRDAKLAIMRDSRVGSYGALALCLSTLMRVFALAAILEQGAKPAALALIATGAVSRVAGLTPMLVLPPARADGAGASSSPPSLPAARRAFVIALCIGLLPALGGATLAQSCVAHLAAVLAAAGVAKLAHRQIGGYTGDVLGAAQQAAEIAALIALSAS